MGKKPGRILLPLLISFLILFFNSDTSKSCIGDGGPDDYMYSVFNERLINQPALEPFLLSNYLFHPYMDSVFNEERINLDEWAKYFKYKVDTADIKKVMYSTTFIEVNSIYDKIKTASSGSIDPKWKKNKLVNYWERTKDLNSLEYIIFAKKCEPLVTGYWDWDPPVRDTSLMLNLIDEGVFEAKNSNDEFLKLRYAFQAIRLAHYSGSYQKAVDLYDNLVSPLNTENMVKYWSLSLKAGALRHLGQESLSNYLFALVFHHCPPKRFTATLSFKVKSDSSFQQSLSFCKSREEKSALWVIYAYKNKEVVLDAMKNIFRLKPDSPYLELLLAREVNRVESELLPARYYWGDYRFNIKGNDYAHTKNNIRLTGIVEECARSGKTIHPYLWDLTAGYLMALTGENANADKFFDSAAEKWPENDTIHLDRIRFFRIINKINSIRNITPADEEDILPDLKWLQEKSNKSEEVKYTASYECWLDNDQYTREEGESAYLFVRVKLAQLYQQKGDYAKLHMCMGDYRFNYSLDSNPENEPLDAIIEFLDKPDKTEYEKFLQSIYDKSRSYLLSMKAMMYMNRHEFEKARNVYLQLDDTNMIRSDPFAVRLNDCSECDYRSPAYDKYTPLRFVQKMIELDSLARIDSDSSAQYYFMLGNGLYNLGYFGNSWYLASTYRDADHYEFGSNNGDWRFYDCTDAMKNYMKAMNTARDRELAAKCCFLAAKCEQNTFYNQARKISYWKDGGYKKMKSKYRTCFKILKEKYYNTDFYKEVIRECSYFNYYVKAYN